jgi:hypothetical protein
MDQPRDRKTLCPPRLLKQAGGRGPQEECSRERQRQYLDR